MENCLFRIYFTKELNEEIEQKWIAWFQRYADRLGQEQAKPKERKVKMNSVNPKFVLRNYMAQTAISKAVVGDYSEIDLMLKILQNPFEEHPEAEHYAGLPPDWAETISVSCSS